MPQGMNEWPPDWPDRAGVWYDVWKEDSDVPIELDKDRGFPPVPPAEPAEAAEQVRGTIRIEAVVDKTLVFAVVSDIRDYRNNTGKFVPCQEGTAIGGYAHDRERDAVLVDGVEVAHLGTVGLAFDATMPSAGPWRAPVPMPEAVVEQLVSGYYRRRLVALREKYPPPQYKVEYVQLRGCN